MRSRVLIAVFLTAALAIFGFGLARILAARPITEPRQARALDRSLLDAACSDRPMLALGDRMIVWCDRAFAWIDVARSTSKIAWRLPPEKELANWTVVALAPRDNDTFAVAVQGYAGHNKLAFGIAGRDGWLTEPVEVANLEGSLARVLALAWMNGRAELVVANLYGPPAAFVLAPGDKTPARRPLPWRTCSRDEDERCRTVLAALPHGDGWKTLARYNAPTRDSMFVVELFTVDGSEHRLLELQWWVDPKTGAETANDHHDMSAFGIIDSRGGAKWIIEVDGGRRPIPAPGANFEPYNHNAFVFADGAMKRVPAFSSIDPKFYPNAFFVGGRWIYSDGPNDDLRVGSSPDTLARVASDFGYGRAMARPDGTITFVSMWGAHITLDQNLRRIDHLSLFDHLRAQASELGGSFVWRVGVILFGLPIALVLGAILVIASRRGIALLAPLAIYIMLGGWCLGTVLSKLT